MVDFTQDDGFEEEAPKSKSQVKREMLALQALGERLTQLNAEQFAKVPLTDRTRDAVHAYLALNKREAKRRQLQFIGRLMREENHEAITEAVESLESGSRQQVVLLHQVERWRDALLNDGATALTQFLQEYPQTDRQHLRQLVTNCVKDRAQGKKRGQEKKLFQLLKAVLESASTDTASTNTDNDAD